MSSIIYQSLIRRIDDLLHIADNSSGQVPFAILKQRDFVLKGIKSLQINIVGDFDERALVFNHLFFLLTKLPSVRPSSFLILVRKWHHLRKILQYIHTGWLLYGGPEKTKDCVQVVPPINKLLFKILNSTNLGTKKHSDLLCSASYRPELAIRL